MSSNCPPSSKQLSNSCGQRSHPSPCLRGDQRVRRRRSTWRRQGTTDQTWLVMLYQDADDKILEQDIYVDLNEAERVGSSDRVHIVAQVDRYPRRLRGDGDWSGTRRYLRHPGQ